MYGNKVEHVIASLRAALVSMTPRERQGFQRAFRAKKEGRFVALATERQKHAFALTLELQALELQALQLRRRNQSKQRTTAARRPEDVAGRRKAHRPVVRSAMQRAARLEKRIAAEVAAMPMAQRAEFLQAEAAARAYGKPVVGTTPRQRRILRMQGELSVLRAGQSAKRAQRMLDCANGKVARVPEASRLMKALARTNPGALPERFQQAIPATN